MASAAWGSAWAMDFEEAWAVVLVPVLDGLSATALATALALVTSLWVVALVLGRPQPGIAGDKFGSSSSKTSRDLHHLRRNRKGRPTDEAPRIRRALDNNLQGSAPNDRY
jgi:hypothetical protein